MYFQKLCQFLLTVKKCQHVSFYKNQFSGFELLLVVVGKVSIAGISGISWIISSVVSGIVCWFVLSSNNFDSETELFEDKVTFEIKISSKSVVANIQVLLSKKSDVFCLD